MPTNGTSCEWLEQRENEIAMLIDAKDNHLDTLRTDYKLLYQRGAITPALYSERMDRIDKVAHALLVGKSNTARLRNNGEI